MNYVNGFVAAVPTASREAYRKHAQEAVLAFKARGAPGVVECWGDDVPEGKLTSFPVADPRMQPATNPMPFDGKRLTYGGFQILVEAFGPTVGPSHIR